MNEYVIAAFRSRNSSTKLLDILKKNGISATIVNTPKEAYIGCGLSVKFEQGLMEPVRICIVKNSLAAFAGFFSVSDYKTKVVARHIG
jgi:hypothetical protein